MVLWGRWLDQVEPVIHTTRQGLWCQTNTEKTPRDTTIVGLPWKELPMITRPPAGGDSSENKLVLMPAGRPRPALHKRPQVLVSRHDRKVDDWSGNLLDHEGTVFHPLGNVHQTRLGEDVLFIVQP